MRVLVVTREVPPVGGGAGHEAANLAAELTRRGHDVDILTMHHGTLPSVERRDRLSIHRLAVGRRQANSSTIPEMLVFLVRATLTARRLARRHSYDVAHAHALLPEGLVLLGLRFALRRARQVPPPIVITAHGSDVPGYNPDRYRIAHRLLLPLWRRAVRAYDVVTTPSQHLRGMIQTLVPDRAVELLPYGIDPGLVTPHGSPPRSGFLVVSRLLPRKNVHVFLQALKHIDEPQDVHVVGEGPELERLQALAATLPRHDVRFHGWLDHGGARWRALYEGCRFFVFLSSSENFPVSLLEAQLAGMVTVASDVPGVREVLGDEARYVKTIDPAAVAACVKELLRTEADALAAEGRRARRRVVDNYSTAASADRFEKLFARLAG